MASSINAPILEVSNEEVDSSIGKLLRGLKDGMRRMSRSIQSFASVFSPASQSAVDLVGDGKREREEDEEGQISERGRAERWRADH
jgi:hypothetical protein